MFLKIGIADQLRREPEISSSLGPYLILMLVLSLRVIVRRRTITWYLLQVVIFLVNQSRAHFTSLAGHGLARLKYLSLTINLSRLARASEGYEGFWKVGTKIRSFDTCCWVGLWRAKWEDGLVEWSNVRIVAAWILPVDWLGWVWSLGLSRESDYLPYLPIYQRGLLSPGLISTPGNT